MNVCVCFPQWCHRNVVRANIRNTAAPQEMVWINASLVCQTKLDVNSMAVAWGPTLHKFCDSTIARALECKQHATAHTYCFTWFECITNAIVGTLQGMMAEHKWCIAKGLYLQNWHDIVNLVMYSVGLIFDATWFGESREGCMCSCGKQECVVTLKSYLAQVVHRRRSALGDHTMWKWGIFACGIGKHMFYMKRCTEMLTIGNMSC